MGSRLFKLMYDLRASYWFVPSVMALLAVVLGGVVVWFDAGPGAGLLDGLGWYQKAKPDGAQEVLSTIAGSMITVAGVVFSITIVAIAYSASQYGPRILTNFMSDRGNQVTLGTFIATFLYCLVVLRTIRGGDEGEFVPQLAVMIALLLAICSIAVLIYFIHHVPSSIHINTVVGRIGEQLVLSIRELFPEPIGDSPEDRRAPGSDPAAELRSGQANDACEITSLRNGYIEAIDDETVMQTACRQDLVLRMHHRPGDYVLSGETLLSASPGRYVDDEVKDALRHSYSIGKSRTPAQDIFFLVDELVEISARALSTGVNDPYTAITSLGWLTAAAAEFGRRRIPSSRRVDRNGVVRVIARPYDFAELIDRGFGRMRQYVARDAIASKHAFERLASVGKQCGRAEVKAAVRAEAGKLLALTEHNLQGPSLCDVRDCYSECSKSWA